MPPDHARRTEPPAVRDDLVGLRPLQLKMLAQAGDTDAAILWTLETRPPNVTAACRVLADDHDRISPAVFDAIADTIFARCR